MDNVGAVMLPTHPRELMVEDVGDTQPTRGLHITRGTEPGEGLALHVARVVDGGRRQVVGALRGGVLQLTFTGGQDPEQVAVLTAQTELTLAETVDHLKVCGHTSTKDVQHYLYNCDFKN